MTRVVNLRHEPYDVYIGRPGKGKCGYYGNPHPVSKKPIPGYLTCPVCDVHHTLEESLEEFSTYFFHRLRTDAVFRKNILALRGKTLGCFCRPKDGFKGRLLCHGQIIAGFLDEIPPEHVD